MAENSSSDFPVLVVGAGPTGLMMAAELARHGLKCRIIDKEPAASDRSKALAIHARTLEILEDIGIVDQFVAAGIKGYGMSMYAEGRRLFHLGFNEIDSRYKYALLLPQSETERLLNNHLERLGVKVERGVELVGFVQDSASVLATLKLQEGSEQNCRARYLVGCDGAHSTTRHTLQLSFEGSEYEESFALADVLVDWNFPDDEISGFLTDTGTVFFFPVGHGRYRILADIDKVPADKHEPTLADMRALVDQRCHRQVRLHDPNWLTYFRIHRRQAPTYRVDRVFIAGDASHIHSPAGGQGMNTGLQDAYNLAWKLALVLKGAGQPALIDSYSAERHAVGKAVLQATDLMMKVIELRNPIALAIRNRLAPVIAGAEVAVHRVSREISEISINYRESPIVGDYYEGLFGGLTLLGVGPHPGDRCPDIEGLRLRDESSKRLFEIIRGSKHCLLLLAGVEGKASDYSSLIATGKQVQHQYGDYVTSYIVVGSGTIPPNLGWDGEVLFDDRLALHRAFHGIAPGLYLIRPDGYVGYRSFPPNPAHLFEFLNRIFV